MSIAYLSAAFAIEGLRPTAKLVLLKLADNANDDGYCYPSRAHIERHTGLSKSTISRTVKQLAEKGIIEIIPQYSEGVQLPNHYRLRLEMKGVGAEEHGGRRRGARGVGAEEHTEPSEGTVNEPTPHSPPDEIKDMELPAELSREAWHEWVDYRRARRQKLTKQTAERQIQKLSRMASHGIDPDAVIEQSIEQGWQGLFELKDNRYGRPRDEFRNPFARAAMSRAEAERNAVEYGGPLLEHHASGVERERGGD